MNAEKTRVILFDIEWETDDDDLPEGMLPDHVSYLFPKEAWRNYNLDEQQMFDAMLEEALGLASGEYHYFIKDCRIRFEQP
jgi:hypothetical protein